MGTWSVFFSPRVCIPRQLLISCVKGFLLWNAGRVVAEYLEVHAEELVQGKDILELGAGAGLPSCVAAIKGARTVVVTDYPDPSLVKNLQYNAERMKAQSLIPSGTKLSAEGYAWGRDIKPLNAHLPPAPELAEGAARFDLLILADVIYNYEQHHSLIKSVEMTLKRSPDASALVVSSPYEPWLWDKIIAFLPLAEQRGFEVKKLFETMVDKVMFEDDPGDEATRRTVHGYELRWKKEELDKAAS